MQAKRYDIQLVDFSPPRPTAEVNLFCSIKRFIHLYEPPI